MNILVIGSKQDFAKLQNKLTEKHDYTYVEDASLALKYFDEQDVVFDFLIDEYPDNIEAYKTVQELAVFLNIPKLSLAEIHYYNEDIECQLFGFNGLPGFFEKPMLEVSVYADNEKSALEVLLNKLKLDYNLVEDRVGMVTPRVVSMIINEACYTVMEGTASAKDIDLGMKLGTNYPEGPFEWLEKISVKHVYEILEAIYDDTKDERYKIAPMLKRSYLALK